MSNFLLYLCKKGRYRFTKKSRSKTDEMNKVTVIVEKTATGYSAYLLNIPWVTTVADTFYGLQENVAEVINLYVETAKEYKEEIPDQLKAKYEIEFKDDI